LEYPVAVSVPGAKLGEYVRHNEYYKSKGSADATTVYVDLSQYQPVYVNKYRNMVHDLAKKYPDVNFRILNDPGKYTAKYTVEDLIRLTEEATELYKRGPDPRIAELEKQKDELRAPYRTGEGYYKNIPRQVHDTVVEIDKEIAGLRRAGNREISEAEAKIRDAERDVDIVEGTDFSGETLYSGIPLDAIGRQVSAYWKASKEATRIKAKEAKAILRESLTKHWLNQAGNIRRDMERIGQGAYDLIIAQTLAKGGHPRATNMRKQATHEYRRGFSFCPEPSSSSAQRGSSSGESSQFFFLRSGSVQTLVTIEFRLQEIDPEELKCSTGQKIRVAFNHRLVSPFFKAQYMSPSAFLICSTNPWAMRDCSLLNNSSSVTFSFTALSSPSSNQSCKWVKYSYSERILKMFRSVISKILRLSIGAPRLSGGWWHLKVSIRLFWLCGMNRRRTSRAFTSP